MKRNLFLPFLLFVSFYASAQTAVPEVKDKKTGNEWHSVSDAIPRAHEFTNRLTKELNLSDNTSKKVYDTYLANTKSLDEIKMGIAGETDKLEQLKNNREVFNDSLKKILTSEQFNKYLKMPSDKTWRL
jgi:septal ring factor EnvC (AmiA/AmiB activator)